jgi:transketolase
MFKNLTELEFIARQIRGKIVEMSHKSGGAHLGSALSCVDILVALYWNVLNISPEDFSNPDRDRFIFSKGHASLSLFACLAFRNFFEKGLLDTYAKPGSCLEEHPGPSCVPGLEAATGSLGHGLSLGVGIALAAKIQSRPYKTYVLLSDGECNEGSVWEAAMFASGQQLDNICSIIDFNKWQATGRSCEVMALEPLGEKWESFGWNVYEINGHDINYILNVLNSIPYGSGKPTAVIAHTVKGKGISFMEDDNNWHYRIPNEEEVILAKKELGLL